MEYAAMLVVFASICAWYAKIHGRNPWAWGAAALVGHVFACAALLFVCRRRRRTIHEYLAKYPHCKTSKGIACAACNSTSIRLWVHKRTFFNEAKHICNHCGTHLYSS
jgi:hypothetical protein